MKKNTTMRHNIFKKIGLFLLLAVIVSSCEKWIDTDLNIDPDAPSDVPMELILPAIQSRVAFNVFGGNDMTRTQNIWMQTLTGIARQSQSEGTYTLRAGDVNNLWGSVYNGSLMDAKQLIERAQAQNSPHFEGVAKVLMAVTYASATNVFGDIPFTEAVQGKDILEPAFDPQENIYTGIQTMLDEAITLLSGPAGDIALSGDIIFQNDAAKWIQAAYAFKARYALQLSERNSNAWTEALAHLNNAFTSHDGSMYYYYGSSVVNGNPLYLFMDQRGDVAMSSYLINILKNDSDPRLPVLALPISDTIFYNNDTILPGDYFGSPAEDVIGNASSPGSAIASVSAPTPFITYAELLFIKAEAQHNTGVDAKPTLLDAVKASLEQYGVFDQTWFDNYSTTVTGLSGDALYAEIMRQKYIAGVYTNEIFNDWRRTGYPVLTPNPANPDDGIPHRFPYPTDAVTFNSNTPTGVTIFQKVWWDQ